MTPPVSTSGCDGLAELGCVAMSFGVVRDAVDPAAVDHACPGPGEDADGVLMIVAACNGAGVDVGCPGTDVTAVVGEGGDRDPEAGIAGPAEMDGTMLTRLLGHRREAREGRDGVGRVVSFAAVTPLGEHLGGVDLTRPWQRREDRPVRVFAEPGGHRPAEIFQAAAN